MQLELYPDYMGEVSGNKTATPACVHKSLSGILPCSEVWDLKDLMITFIVIIVYI